MDAQKEISLSKIKHCVSMETVFGTFWLCFCCFPVLSSLTIPSIQSVVIFLYSGATMDTTTIPFLRTLVSFITTRNSFHSSRGMQSNTQNHQVRMFDVAFIPPHSVSCRKGMWKQCIHALWSTS
ncbi:uncharacterized protein J3D65DRAFT_625022 [Phyllosticta citribraziliensis]|uniref:Uncharacterized protein n=1 Tax=Phyllosticta citribraziliensis TaxID=989973 RepID=A0ABR1LQ34_9PEZI